MSEKKQESFTVTDRRLFTAEGELRREASEEEVSTREAGSAACTRGEASSAECRRSRLALDPSVPPSPTAAEQKEQADAYRKSAKELDTRVELSGHSAKEMEMTFERFMASLYMTAMLQLGLMQEERGQPRIDLLGARQTVDTLGPAGGKNQGQPHRAGRKLFAELPLRIAHGLRGGNQRSGPAAAGDRRESQRETMKATLTVLGSGTSMGVPTIGCDCAVCRSSDPHDRRTRPSVLIEYGGAVVLIDTTPDFREQAIREDIRSLDAVLYTHAHADHILGIDDLRPLSFHHRPGRAPALCPSRRGGIHPQDVPLHL